MSNGSGAMSKPMAITLGVGTALGFVILMVAAATKNDPVVDNREARDALFEPAPCVDIRFRGGGDGPPPTSKELRNARKFFFAPRIREYLELGAAAQAAELGVTTNELLTARLLLEMFPECPDTFPPQDLTSGVGFVWLGMRFFVAGITQDVEAKMAGEAGS